MSDEVKVDESVKVEVAAPVKRGRGRPKGSKNKPKVALPPAPETVVAVPAVEVDNGF